jgi:ATP-binding cassette subfamily F protein uup
MADASSDHVRLRELQRELEQVVADRDRLEEEWLEAAESAG